MIFEAEGMRVIQPLDPYQGPRFTEPVDDRDEPGMLDHLYTLIVGKREDYINPTAGVSISWRSIQSSETGSKATWDAWQQGRYELNTRRCEMISRLNWIGTEISDYHKYYGIESVDILLNRVDREMREDQKIPFLDITLMETPARWWRTHRSAL